MENVTALKIRRGDDIRRISLQKEEVSFEQVKDLAKALFVGIKEPIVFRYRDDENDLITISTEREFAEAVRLSEEKGNAINIIVEDPLNPEAVQEEKNPFVDLIDTFIKELEQNGGNCRRGPCSRGQWKGGFCGSQQSKPVHQAICDSCTASGKPEEYIQGTRFKCATCLDYDLCQACFDKQNASPGTIHDKDHKYFAIPFPRRFNSCPNFRRGVPIHAAICDGCKAEGKPEDNIRGTRFKCTSCPDYDLCQSCIEKEKTDPGSVHDKEHSQHFIAIEHPFFGIPHFFNQSEEKSQQPTSIPVEEEKEQQPVVVESSKETIVKEKPQEPTIKPGKEEEEVGVNVVKEEESKEKKKKNDDHILPPFVKKLNQLEEMGFMEKEKNIALLVKYQGNLVDTVKELLGL